MEGCMRARGPFLPPDSLARDELRFYFETKFPGKVRPEGYAEHIPASVVDMMFKQRLGAEARSLPTRIMQTCKKVAYRARPFPVMEFSPSVITW
jgi:hypothetical protein